MAPSTVGNHKFHLQIKEFAFFNVKTLSYTQQSMDQTENEHFQKF